MTPADLALAMAVGIVLLSVAGPLLLDHAGVALRSRPRAALGVLSGVVVLWVGSLLALGPVLAWVVTGPVWLPPFAAKVCQSCLAASNPYSSGVIDTAIPAAVLLLAPAVVVGGLTAATVRRSLVRARSSRAATLALLTGASRRSVLGHRVSVVTDPRGFALALPPRRGGIVLSTGALDLLDADELAAVLQHEQAHLSQRHHVLAALVGGVARSLRWVPLMAAVERVLPDYLELAADDQARRRSGTRPLVGALPKLGERPHVPGGLARRPPCTRRARPASTTWWAVTRAAARGRSPSPWRSCSSWWCSVSEQPPSTCPT